MLDFELQTKLEECLKKVALNMKGRLLIIKE